jgi:hypothetical protein
MLTAREVAVGKIPRNDVYRVSLLPFLMSSGNTLQLVLVRIQFSILLPVIALLV